MMSYLDCGDRRLSLKQPVVMGILNVTPDSFSDGGELFSQDQLSLEKATARARAMVAEGAAIIDVGGESTRPGAESITIQQELNRVAPVVERICSELDVAVSVDTSTPAVMREAAALGAHLINDVRALHRSGALCTAQELGLPVSLMHMKGEPGHMQDDPHYEDVVEEVIAFLAERIRVCQDAGIAKEKIIIDPGFGFGKSLQHNLILLNRLARLEVLDAPILVGLSRKSTIGKIVGRESHERLNGSLSAAVLAVSNGARIVRVHDVRPTVEALQVLRAVTEENSQDEKSE